MFYKPEKDWKQKIISSYDNVFQKVEDGEITASLKFFIFKWSCLLRVFSRFWYSERNTSRVDQSLL